MAKVRTIVRIDEEKCDGCGLCVPACAEGAIKVIGGKARLVSEAYCDGLGACLGECPQDAISLEEREAEEFDPTLVEHAAPKEVSGRFHLNAEPGMASRGCPAAAPRVLRPPMEAHAGVSGKETNATSSELQNWPVQISLVPIRAPYLAAARLLISADCVPFALADFHRRFLKGRILLVGCPKLDNAEAYQQKLAELLAENDIKAIEIVHMEVPCCTHLVRLVLAALDHSGKRIPVTATKVGLRGDVHETVRLRMGVDPSLEDRLLEAVRSQFGKDHRRITHAIAVHGLAQELLDEEEGDPRVVLTAALLHDIGIQEAERRHGSSAAPYQELEGPPIARRVMEGLGLDGPTIDHVCRIVANHHSGRGIDTPEFRIVWDADLLVNLSEWLAGGDGAPSNATSIEAFRTESGRRKACELFAGREEE